MEQRTWTALFCTALVLAAGLTLAQVPDSGKAALRKAREALAAAEQAEQAEAAREAKAKIREARLALVAEKAWAGRQAAASAEAARTAAEKDRTAKAALLKTEQGKAAEAARAAEKAIAEKAEAEKAFRKAAEGKKDEAKKVLDQKSAAAEKAAASAAAAKQTAGLAASAVAAAEKAVAEKTAALNLALDAAAQLHAEALGGLKPITTDQWDYAKARHLLFRAGFGGPPEEVERLVKLGPHKAVDFLVEYHARPATNLELAIRTWEQPLAYEDRLHAEARGKLAEREVLRDNTQHAELFRWWLQRMVETQRPLEEKLVLFWHDHFATSYLALRDAYLMHQQNQMFRRHADKFDALLHGIVQDPAMIRYLNNDENVKGSNNENLGRELLELFSIGEENSAAHKSDGYTEKDVRDGNTRALTGATFDRWSGQFRFYQGRHDTSAKALLGQTGTFGAHEAVDIMLQHPATARYVAKKLCQYFACWEPEPAMIEKLAHVLRENHYNVRPMLKNLFLSEEFYSDKAMASHIKSPVELLVGTTQTLKLAKPDYEKWRQACTEMGHAIFDPPSVAGWPEGPDWINANLLLVRYNAVANLVRQSNLDVVALLEGRALGTPAEVVEHLAKRCLLTGLTEEKRQSLIRFLGPLPPSSDWARQRDQVNTRLRALVVLLLSTPEYQVS